jgi:putative sugar O-methyltransferase
MHDLPELNLALKDMQEQREIYKPTVFWRDAASRIAIELRSIGMEGFRSLPTALSYFVPTYGPPGVGLTHEQAEALRGEVRRLVPENRKPQLAIDQFLSGELAALSDYRVLLAADDPERLPHLHAFSESEIGRPVEQFVFEGRRFSRSSLNYLLGLALLKKHLDGDIPRTVLEVGGGFGTLGEVLFAAGISDLRYIDIDIPPNSFVAQHYLSKILGSQNVAGYAHTRGSQPIDIHRLPPAAALCSWQIDRLRGNVDLFVNFISFQEMEPLVVRNYLDHVSRLGTRWVLLRNMREGKQTRKGAGTVGVREPIVSADYLAMLPDYELVASNVLPYGIRTVDGFHSELLILRRKS